jgi:hypothetical protein
MARVITIKQDDEVVLEFEVTNAMLMMAKKLGITDKEYILAMVEDKLEEKGNEQMRREVP